MRIFLISIVILFLFFPFGYGQGHLAATGAWLIHSADSSDRGSGGGSLLSFLFGRGNNNNYYGNYGSPYYSNYGYEVQQPCTGRLVYYVNGIPRYFCNCGMYGTHYQYNTCSVMGMNAGRRRK